MITRALRICDIEHLDQEINHVSHVFINNGYDHGEFNKAVSNGKKPKGKRIRKEKGNNGNIKRISLSYIKVMSGKLAKIMKRRNIEVAFKSPNTIGKMVGSLK